MYLPDPRKNSLMGVRNPNQRGWTQLPAPRRIEPPAAPQPSLFESSLFAEQEKARHERREKWLRGRANPKSPLQRQKREEPPASDRFAKTLSIEIVQDRRLPPRCAMALMQIRAWAGKGGWVSTTYRVLARHLNVTRRQAINLVRELAQYGYILKTTCTEHTGRHSGLAVLLTEKALPPYERVAWAAKYVAAWAQFVVVQALRKSCGGGRVKNGALLKQKFTSVIPLPLKPDLVFPT